MIQLLLIIKRLIHRYKKIYLILRFFRSALVRWRYRLRDVHYTSLILKPEHISSDFKTGEYCYLSKGARIVPRVQLGKYVIFGPNVSIVGGDHNYDQPGVPITFTNRPSIPETIIEDDVWVGQNVLIKAGVKIGCGAIIAMGSVVTKDIKPYSIVAGVPAIFIKKRFVDSQDEINHDVMLLKAPKALRFCKPRY